MVKRMFALLICLLLFVALSAGSCELSNYSYSSHSIPGTWQGCYGTDPKNPYTCVSGSGTPGHCPDYFSDLSFFGNQNHPLIRETCH